MRFIRMLLMRGRALLRSGAVDDDLADEMREHLERLTQEHIAGGMTPAAAREAARREFGPVTQLVEESRDARGVAWILNAWQDARYGVRLMMRAPAFAAAVILTVALGIGATTAMFSVVYGIVLKPLPYREPDRLVDLWSTAIRRGLPRAPVGMANVYDWRARNHVFEAIAVLRAANLNLTGEGEPERLNAAPVSANLFSVLGVTALYGRTFIEGEDRIGHERVALLSYPFWARRFAADPAIVGRSILLSGVQHTVVGVMREDFAYPSRDYQIYTPLTFDPQELVNRMNYSYLSVARLKHGVTVEQAQEEMRAISADIEREHPKENEGIGTAVVPMLDDTVAATRAPLFILLAAVGAMLLIGCANLVNLLVARALSREREFAVRAALGAARARLILQSLGELLPVLAAGGALGLLAAASGVRALLPLMPADMPRVENVGLHLPVLAFTAVVLTSIAAFVGVWPALEASRGALGTSVPDASRGSTGGPRRARLRDALVVVQIAGTLWLVVAAVLLMRSFSAVKQVNPGFDPARVYSLHLAIPRSRYPTDRDVAAFSGRIVERVRGLPGVESAGLVNRLPLAGGAQTGPIEVEGVDPKTVSASNVDYRSVTPEYFRTLRIPLVRGRPFADMDTATSPPVAIVDERLADTMLAGVDPIGRRVRIPVRNLPWLTIVGVAGHIRHDRLDEDVRPQIYFPFTQRTQDRLALAVRTRGEPSAIGADVVGAIRSIDPEQPVYDARTLDAVVERSLAQRWLQTSLLGIFATVAVVLASIGVYGVIAYAVGQRRREFGIRLALGAHRGEIVGLVMRRGVALFVAGAAGGLLVAVVSARVLSSLLFSVSALDVPSFAAATVVLFAVTLAACAIPARRAADVDPSIALRAE